MALLLLLVVAVVCPLQCITLAAVAALAQQYFVEDLQLAKAVLLLLLVVVLQMACTAATATAAAAAAAATAAWQVQTVQASGCQGGQI
jgi:hypothetical protein